MTDDHHHGTMRVHPLGHAEKADAVIGDQICEVVLEKRENAMNKQELLGAAGLKSHLEKAKRDGGIWGKCKTTRALIKLAAQSP